MSIFIAAYRARRTRCVRARQVLIAFSQDFVAQDKCKEIALNQIAAGSRVVFQVAGCGLGALDAAREKAQRWGIGVDKDQSNLGAHILTSAVKRVDTSVFLTSRAAKSGTFRGGVDAVFNQQRRGDRKISRGPKAFIKTMNALSRSSSAARSSLRSLCKTGLTEGNRRAGYDPALRVSNQGGWMTARRWLPLLLVLVAVGAAGCGGDDNEGAATTAETQAESVTAGLVSDVGRFNDKSFNQSALEGLNRAKDELGADTRAIESRAAGDYVPNLSSLARQHYDVLIGVGFLLAEAVSSVARKFPDENFAIIDYFGHGTAVHRCGEERRDAQERPGLTFATNENSYLIGCMAAMMAKKQEASRSSPRSAV